MVALKKADFRCWSKTAVYGGGLTSESVESTALAFQRVHYVHGGHGLPLGVFRLSDGVTDNVLQEHLQHTAGFFVYLV